ncbi:hypothetical protein [Deinococcus cellulosilyticus]|uniref:Uncharacterized protein n=1 Tax=Deinococcus cellulosilyticus (strain DSM 18568 / NBRC 106333 / KACC 11606 / 5516J-15) TaxID=1223518 RepID=A0A511MXN7_DEIC1|nr:hypothetical protein [Deinococcus cellulosilyticus]GEM45329.1 hypothetical protein DC3_09640 [Deinococcus cellulosilyticus NBRC 106333 = KACC 11606]
MSEDLTPPTSLQLVDIKNQAINYGNHAEQLARDGDSQKLQEQVLQVAKWLKWLNDPTHPTTYLLQNIKRRLEMNLQKALTVTHKEKKKQSKTKLSGLFGGQS